MTVQLPEYFSQTITKLYGKPGRDWLVELPALIASCEQRWSLKVLPPFPNLSFNYVAPALRQDDLQMILKLGVPNPELLMEIEALRVFDGRGTVRLLDADPEQGILLLERLTPGAMLSTLENDEQATTIAAAVMQQLWRPVPAQHSFPTINQWASGLKRLRKTFNGGSGPFPESLVKTAEELFVELLETMENHVLLHGDLHHFNILRAERVPWLAIDPKGVTGEPACEVGPLLRNPWPGLLEQPDPKRVLSRRVDQLAEELSLDRQRLLMWGTAQAVLSAWWNYEDFQGGYEWALECARILNCLL